MRKLITALVATATVIAGSLVGTATATTVAGVGSLPSLTKNSSPVANVACWCGQYQCACRWAGPGRCARHSQRHRDSRTRRRRGHWCSSKISYHSS